jgi:hypothetical protein
MNDTANYLGQTRWRVRQVLSSVTNVTLKTCPVPQGTPLISGGTADAGGTTTTMVDAALIGTSIAMVGKWIRFTGATVNKNLVRQITAFNTTTGTATFGPAVNVAVGAADTYDLWMETTIFNHLVVTGYSISGNNANAAFTTWVLRHVDGAKEVVLGGSMGLTSGSCNKDNSNAWLEMIPNQSLELVVGGSITGQIDVMVEGRILPMTTTSTDFLDGAAH